MLVWVVRYLGGRLGLSRTSPDSHVSRQSSMSRRTTAEPNMNVLTWEIGRQRWWCGNFTQYATDAANMTGPRGCQGSLLTHQRLSRVYSTFASSSWLALTIDRAGPGIRWHPAVTATNEIPLKILSVTYVVIIIHYSCPLPVLRFILFS